MSNIIVMSNKDHYNLVRRQSEPYKIMQCLWLYYKEGKTASSVAPKLNVSANTLKRAFEYIRENTDLLPQMEANAKLLWEQDHRVERSTPKTIKGMRRNMSEAIAIRRHILNLQRNGYSYAEISQITEIPLATVKYYIVTRNLLYRPCVATKLRTYFAISPNATVRMASSATGSSIGMAHAIKKEMKAERENAIKAAQEATFRKEVKTILGQSTNSKS